MKTDKARMTKKEMSRGLKHWFKGKYCYDYDKEIIEDALASLYKMVMDKKKGRKIYFGEDQSSDKVKSYNQAVQDIADLFKGKE